MSESISRASAQSEREVRIQKIQKMRALGVIPYAQSYDKTHLIADIIKSFEVATLREIETIIPESQLQVATAGRVMLYRSHGKLAFAKLLDSTAQIQLMFHRDQCALRLGDQLFPQLSDEAGEGISAYKFMEKLVDIGDFIGVKGEVFRTHKGELTIFVSEFSFLSKSIR